MQEAMLRGRVSGHDVTVRYDSKDGPSFFVEIQLSSGGTLRQRILHVETSPPDSQDYPPSISTLKRKQPPEETRSENERTTEVKRLRRISAAGEVNKAVNDSANLESEENNINSVLPPEVLSMIFELVSTSSGKVMSIVGSFVCRLWSQLLRPYRKSEYWSSFTSRIAEHGWLSLLQWARQNKCLLHEGVCSAAAKIGRLDILQWARENGCSWSATTCENAAEEGHIEILEWAARMGCGVNEWTARAAARGGQGEVLKWLKDNGCPWGPSVSEELAEAGDLELLKWVKEEGGKLGFDCFSSAVKGGDIEMLDWLKANGCSMINHNTEYLSAVAAARGSIAILEWLIDEGCLLHYTAREEAIKAGHLDVLKWLIAHHCPGNIKMECSLAAKYEEPEIFKFLLAEHQKNFKWDEEVCASAALLGDLEVFKWLRNEGCPWDERAVNVAAKWGNMEVLKWAVQNDCPWPRFDARSVAGWETFDERSSREIWQYIYDQGHFCDTSHFQFHALDCGNLVALKWCHQIGVPFDVRECRMAAEKGRLDILKWLISVGVPWHRSVLEAAMERKDLKMLKWLLFHGGRRTKE